METTRLLIFKTIADKGSFSKAAETLHLSQPAVSLAIQALEQQYGTKLLQRNTRGATLTEAGKVLYDYACRLLELYEAAEQALQEYNRTPRGRLAVGASTIVGDYILPRLGGVFVNQYPEIQLTVEIANTQEIIHRLQEQALEIALVEFPVNNPGVVAQPFMEDELVVIAGPCHPWANRRRISLEELRNEPFIVREEGSGTRKLLEERLAACGTSLKDFAVRLTLGSNQAIKEAVQAGLGVAIMSQWAVTKECSFGLLHCLRVKNLSLKRHFYYVVLKHYSPSLPSRLFLNLLTSSTFSQAISTIP